MRVDRCVLVSLCLALLGGVGRAAAQDDEGFWVRPRAGGSLVLGGTLGEPEGWLAGGNVRVGAQLGEYFATYYQATMMYAALAGGTEIDDPDDDGDSDNAFVMWNVFLFEATVLDALSFAVGPSADLYEDCEGSVQATRGCARDSVYFGMHGRVSVGFGAHDRGRRQALTLSFEAHPTWFDEDHMTVSMLGGIGFDLY
ncbi:hypothetical protein [Sandaracinus amylolyticus]|uniref:hypothetical protein n=1 Tax=Sandaracinus amylolyticus TaxID=927083 RepID=UPI001F31ACC4|nr:hypothetical protein [Sandaracinus amylolyticus]UJR86257.1 Hypothetical protein I5071_83390 [Sandaracinus amylolyticus]